MQAESLTLFGQVGNLRGRIECLEGLAQVASGQGRARDAARLYGTAAAQREAFGLPELAGDRAPHLQAKARVRTALGDDAFTEAWVAGAALPLDDAIRLALD